MIIMNKLHRNAKICSYTVCVCVCVCVERGVVEMILLITRVTARISKCHMLTLQSRVAQDHVIAVFVRRETLT
jgi:hypothetical protein